MEQGPALPGEEGAEGEGGNVDQREPDAVGGGRQQFREGLDADMAASLLHEGGGEEGRADEQEDGGLVLPVGRGVQGVAHDHAVGENEAYFMTVPIGIILTIEHIITISAFETPVLEKFLDNNVRDFNPADEKRFVLQMLEQNVYHFLSCLKTLNLRRNRIEKELLHSSRNAELKQLLSIEKSLVYFVNSLNANELLKMKMKRTDFLHINGDEDLTDLFEDIIIDNSQALSMSNVYTNILNGTMDAYSSIISNNLNVIIHRLTVITVVLMVPTLISSFLGMNLSSGLPHDKPWAFYFAIGLTGVVTVLLYWLMSKRKML